VLFGALAKQRLLVGALSFVAFHLHLLCDLAGSGPGWPIWYLYPLSLNETMWSGQWNLASWQNSLIGLAATLAAGSNGGRAVLAEGRRQGRRRVASPVSALTPFQSLVLANDPHRIFRQRLRGLRPGLLLF